ncbi:MAG: OPT/YSL family transporter, partial [Planctomycetes bacterium]|nr:OPT/YSL family transporter [Planctomycetota bacterium]
MTDVFRGAERQSGASAKVDRAARVQGVVIGLLFSTLIAASLTIATAKAGISPGVSPLVVLLGWVFGGAILGSRLRPFLAMAQVTGSGGAAVSAGVIFTAPILQIYFGSDRPVDTGTLIAVSVAGVFLGWGFVGLATRRFLTDPRLPAPEAVACDRLIATATDRPQDRPPVFRSLIVGFLLGAIANAAVAFKWLLEEVAFLTTSFASKASALREPTLSAQLPLPLSPLYLGIGALLTLSTALLIFTGGIVNAVTVHFAAAHGLPPTTFRWVGGAAMTVAVIYSLIRYALDGRAERRRRATAEADADDPRLEISSGMQRALIASIALGFVILIGVLVSSRASVGAVIGIGVVGLVLVSLLSGLGGLLSLQVGSSASPVSGTVFVAMLVLSTITLFFYDDEAGVIVLVPILVAVCVAICAANDSSQDYKTMQLNGYRVSDSFTGQLCGLLAGAIVVPYALAVAHEQLGGLGSEALACPQASFFGEVLRVLFSKSDLFHEDMIDPIWKPVGVGVALGFVAVGLEIWGRRRGTVLSSLAFAVGI